MRMRNTLIYLIRNHRECVYIRLRAIYGAKVVSKVIEIYKEFRGHIFSIASTKASHDGVCLSHNLCATKVAELYYSLAVDESVVLRT